MNMLRVLKSNTLPTSVINMSFVDLLAKWKSWRLEFSIAAQPNLTHFLCP